jgi:hypothetical protein
MSPPSSGSGSAYLDGVAEQLAQASSAEAGRVWELMDDAERAPWIAAWQPVVTLLRTRRELPLSEQEVTAIAQTQRRIAPAGAEDPSAGAKKAAQLIVGLRIRGEASGKKRRR